MEFTLPSTKKEMYTTLQKIYSYYRIESKEYSPIVLSPLNIEKISFTPLTDSEIEAKAEELLKAEHKREVLALKKSINERISALSEKRNGVISSAEEMSKKIIEAYNASESKIEKQAIKNGFTHSSVIIDKLAEAENKKNAELVAVETNKNNVLNEINAEFSSLNSALINADNYYANIHEYEKTAKAYQLKAEQEKLEREIFKYNNGVTEKKLRYANTLVQLDTSYKLKFMEINAVEFTKEQLYDMGYYQDVIDCVCGYYDTLSASDAFSEISNESRLVLYLEDYYQNVVYMYKMRVK